MKTAVARLPTDPAAEGRCRYLGVAYQLQD
ncbi:XRE family transcriptional regulator, partial [Pseudomonas sp. S31]|nr:XRE family transcriptional regulator [Pseudomonas sp. S31]